MKLANVRVSVSFIFETLSKVFRGKSGFFFNFLAFGPILLTQLGENIPLNDAISENTWEIPYAYFLTL